MSNSIEANVPETSADQHILAPLVPPGQPAKAGVSTPRRCGDGDGTMDDDVRPTSPDLAKMGQIW